MRGKYAIQSVDEESSSSFPPENPRFLKCGQWCLWALQSVAFCCCGLFGESYVLCGCWVSQEFFYIGISKFFETRLCFFLFSGVFFLIVHLNLSHLFCGCVAASLPLKEGFALFQSIVDFSRWCWPWLSSQDALDGRIICWTCLCWRDLQYGRVEDILAVMYIKQVGYLSPFIFQLFLLGNALV